METSAELRALTLDLYKMFEGTDLSLFERHLSQEDGVLAIGTDPAEWWMGYTTIIEKLRAQSEVLTAKVVDANPQAYIRGDVGWVADKVRLVLSNGGEIPDFRWTLVFQREAGEWKIVQMHVSIGIPNEDTSFGEIEL